MKVYFIVILCFMCSLFKSSAQNKPAAKKHAVPASVNLAASIAAGQIVYKQHCLTCHMADGYGVPNMNPPLIKTSYVAGDKSNLIKAVLNGFSESVDIDGQSYSNHMPSQAVLKDQEIADVLTYIRNSFTNKYSAVKAAEVKAVRASNKK